MIRELKYFQGVFLVLFFALLPVDAPGQRTKEVQSISLKAPEEIEYASAVYEAIDAMAKRVKGCINEKQMLPNECLCLHRQSLETVKNAYISAVKKFPAWKDKLVSYKRANDPVGYNVVFDGLDKQLQVACQ